MNVPAQPDPTEPSPPPRAAAPSCLEVDHFCEGCGYNLHGQLVSRDDHLGVMVCRCPECGRFHPANAGTSAGRVWLRRLGTFVLVLWVLAVVAVCLSATATLGGLQAGHLYGYTDRSWVPAPPIPHPRDQVIRMYIASGRSMPSSSPPPPRHYSVARRHPYEPPHTAEEHYRNYHPGDTPAHLLAGFSALAAFCFGAFVAVAMWHVRRHRLWWALLSPALAGAAVLGLWFYWPETEYVRAWGAWRVGGYVLWQSAFIVAGLSLGRPLARGLARIVVPPKPRQLLTFLWTADGLEPPGVGRRVGEQVNR